MKHIQNVQGRSKSIITGHVESKNVGSNGFNNSKQELRSVIHFFSFVADERDFVKHNFKNYQSLNRLFSFI